MHHPSLLKDIGSVQSGEDFFDRVLPKILAHRSEASRTLGVRLRVTLIDLGKSWLVDLSRAEVHPVAPESQSEAPVGDASLELSAERFLGLIRGTVGLESALAAGEIRISGDPGAFAQFALILAS